MDRSDFETLLVKIHGYYPEKFAPLNAAMAQLWFETLHHLPEDLAEQALERWARQHRVWPPEVDQLLEQADYILEDQQHMRRSGSSTKSFLDVLKDAADREAATPERSREDVSYAKLMVRLTERSIAKWQDQHGEWRDKLTTAQRGTQCAAWGDYYAEKRPQLADDLRAAARIFATTAEAEEDAEHANWAH